MSLINPLRNVTAGLRCLSFSSNNWMATASKQSAAPIKNPTPTFALFMNDTYPIIKRNNPNIKPQQMVKLVAQEWKTLPALKKVSYERIFQQQEEDYVKAMNKLTDEQKDDLKRQKKLARDARKMRKLRKQLAGLTSDKPKQTTGYMFFAQDKSKSMPSPVKMAEAVMQCAVMWQKLSDKDRMPYIRMGERAKKNVEAWKQKTSDDGRADKISEVKKKIAVLSSS